jgi:hypothetical protein
MHSRSKESIRDAESNTYHIGSKHELISKTVNKPLKTPLLGAKSGLSGGFEGKTALKTALSRASRKCPVEARPFSVRVERSGKCHSRRAECKLLKIHPLRGYSKTREDVPRSCHTHAGAAKRGSAILLPRITLQPRTLVLWGESIMTESFPHVAPGVLQHEKKQRKSGPA